MKNLKKIYAGLTIVTMLLGIRQVNAQTSNDAIMMNKGQFCNGISYSFSQWTNYWEGTSKGPVGMSEHSLLRR